MSVRSVISWCILIFISAVFAFKYLPRYSGWGHLAATAVVLAQILLLFKHASVKRIFDHRWLYYAGVIALAGITIYSAVSVNIHDLQVDRWSVIDAFFTELRNGAYPYLGKSHMGNYPGPMPFYFVIAAPFYFLGELSLLSILGYIIVVVYLGQKRKELPNSILAFLILLSSFYLYWEVLVRSNVFTFSLLVLVGLVLFDRIQKFGLKQQVLIAVLVGILLSTRSIFVLAYLIFFLVPLRMKAIPKKRWLILSAVGALSFALTFLPLVVFFPEEFWEVNPFVIQSSIMIPGGMVSVFGLLALLASLAAVDSNDKFFYSGIVLFGSILIYGLYHVVISGFATAYYLSDVDISYFIFAVPFLMYYILHEDKTDKELASADILPV